MVAQKNKHFSQQIVLFKTFLLGRGSVLFSALLASRVGRIMHDVPPTSSVFRHSHQVLLCSSGPCFYIIHPVDPRSSFSPSSRNRALYDLLSKHDPSFLMMCPKHFIFLSFTIPSNFLSTPAFSNTHLFVRFSVHDICIIILKHFISNASILLSSSFLIAQPSHLYIATGHTNVLRSSMNR